MERNRLLVLLTNTFLLHLNHLNKVKPQLIHQLKILLHHTYPLKQKVGLVIIMQIMHSSSGIGVSHTQTQSTVQSYATQLGGRMIPRLYSILHLSIHQSLSLCNTLGSSLIFAFLSFLVPIWYRCSYYGVKLIMIFILFKFDKLVWS